MGHIFLQLPSMRKKSREQIYKTTLSSYIYNVVSACAASFRYEWLTGSLFLRRYMFTYYIYMPMIYRYLIDTWNWLQTFVVCSSVSTESSFVGMLLLSYAPASRPAGVQHVLHTASGQDGSSFDFQVCVWPTVVQWPIGQIAWQTSTNRCTIEKNLNSRI